MSSRPPWGPQLAYLPMKGCPFFSCLQQQIVLSSHLHAICFKAFKIELEGLGKMWWSTDLPCTYAMCKGKAAYLEPCLTTQHNCLNWALKAVWMKFKLWCVTHKARSDLAELPADSQPHLALHSWFQCAQLETHCPSGQLMSAFSPVVSAEMPTLL